MTLNDYFDLILVINCDKHVERLRQTEIEFARLGSTFVRIPGVVHNGGKRIPDRTAGAYMAHLSAMELALYQKAKRVLICEDDTMFNPIIIADIPQIETIDYTMLWFNGPRTPRSESFAFKSGPKRHFHCYSIQNINDQLVDYFKSHLSFTNTLVVDTVLEKHPNKDIVCYTTNKLYAIQRPGLSVTLGRNIDRYDISQLPWACEKC